MLNESSWLFPSRTVKRASWRPPGSGSSRKPGRLQSGREVPEKAVPGVILERLRPRSLSLAVMLAAAAVLGACSPPQKEEQAPLVSVQAETVRPDTIRREIQGEALLYAVNRAAIAPKISAPVRKFEVQRGDRVRKGQVLAELENRDLMAAVQASKGDYQQARAQYRATTASSLPRQIERARGEVSSTRERLKATRSLYESRKKLHREGALARKELDQSSVDLAEAQAQYDSARSLLEKLRSVDEEEQTREARARLDAAQARYQRALAELNYSRIRSPIDGIVSERPGYAGEMAEAGTPLITVVQVSEVVARAHIPQGQAALLKVGDEARLSTDAGTDPVAGRVTIVSPALDPESTTVEVWIQASNPGVRLRPGGSVHFSVTAETVAGALVIPQSAVQTGPKGGAWVMVVNAEGRARRRQVKLGIREGARVQVSSGLQSGDRVIVSGAYGLPDDTPVRIEASR